MPFKTTTTIVFIIQSYRLKVVECWNTGVNVIVSSSTMHRSFD